MTQLNEGDRAPDFTMPRLEAALSLPTNCGEKMWSCTSTRRTTRRDAHTSTSAKGIVQFP